MTGEYKVALVEAYIDVLEDLELYKVLMQLIQEGLCTYTKSHTA
jgi:hypothetical protein